MKKTAGYQMKGFSSYPKLNWVAIAFTCIVFFLNIPASKAQTSEDLPYGYRAIWYDCKDPGFDYPNKFMEDDNAAIIQNLKIMDCNTIFMNISTLDENDLVPSTLLNLGLNTHLGYKDKLIDFIDLAYLNNIKVFGVPMLDHDNILTQNHLIAKKKFRRLCYYQYHVREVFPNKMANLQGVVLNLEPWIRSSTGWGGPANNSMCTASGRTFNNNILAQYLNLIKQLHDEIELNNFYNPLVSGGYNPQTLDNVFMGTVHWNWHYFYQINKSGNNDFPNGNFELYTGTHNGEDYFDFILPETYCPSDKESVEACLSGNCISTSLNKLCDDNNNYVGNYESIGLCWQWFRKHYLTSEMYNPILYPNIILPLVLPIEAAPMLFGHAAYMFNDFEDLDCLRDISGYVSLSCYRKENYHGSFIYDYHEAVSLSSGLCQIGLTCTPTPPPTESASDSLSSVRVINAYPNPVSEEFFVTGLLANEKVQVYNFSNQLLVQSSTSPINIAHLPEGFYILRITDELGVVVYNSTISINR